MSKDPPSSSDCSVGVYNHKAPINAVLFWSALICRSLLSLMYLATLIRVRLGSKYTLVTVMTVMLLISAAAGTELTFAWNVFWTCSTISHLTIQEVSYTMKQLCFNVSHWVLACYYNKIADDVPKALEHQWET